MIDAETMRTPKYENASHRQNCMAILRKIEGNGGKYIFTYVDVERLIPLIPRNFSQKVCESMDNTIARRFSKTLPYAVQDSDDIVGMFGNWALNKGAGVFNNISPVKIEASLSDLKKHITDLANMTGTLDELKEASWMKTFKEIKSKRISEITQFLGSEGFGEKFRNNRKTIEENIYGGTPMCNALKKSRDLLRNSHIQNRCLIVISDGDPTDGNPLPIIEEMKNQGIAISTILLAKQEQHIVNPRAFYDKSCADWPKEAERMFQMASEVQNQKLPRGLLTAMHWKLPLSGSCRLFLDANSPEIVREMSAIFSRLGHSTDVLLDIVGQIKLDDILNTDRRELEEEKRQQQVPAIP